MAGDKRIDISDFESQAAQKHQKKAGLYSPAFFVSDIYYLSAVIHILIGPHPTLAGLFCVAITADGPSR